MGIDATMAIVPHDDDVIAGYINFQRLDYFFHHNTLTTLLGNCLNEGTLAVQRHWVKR